MNLQYLCRPYELEASESFWNAHELEVEDVYNGAGPDWMPVWGRAVLTEFLDVFQAAFVIHDWDYYKTDKTREGFNKANTRMKENMKRILDEVYPFSCFWKWPKRAILWNRARLAYKACDQFGWSAWVD